jgi:hypothetical protein
MDTGIYDIPFAANDQNNFFFFFDRAKRCRTTF